jgi:hypothetical protein
MRGTRSGHAKSIKAQALADARLWASFWLRRHRLHLPGRHARDERARLSQCLPSRSFTNRRSREPGSQGAR